MSRLSPVRLALLIAVAAVALQVLLVPLFVGPASHLEPRDLPIAVAGPQPAAGQLAAKLTAARPGAFDVRVVTDADAAIRDRDVYGAVVLGAAGPSLHIASAASPTVATLLTQATAELGQGGPVPVVDVVPTDPDDPRGAAFGAAFLPMAITAMLAGVLTFFLVKRVAARVLAIGAFAVLAGFAGAAVQRFWLGTLPGDYLAIAAGIGLFVLALSAAVAGLGALIGREGLGVGAVTFFLVGNALSGVSAAPELLPQPWGAVGQFLPIGAGATVLRSDAYFGGRGAGMQVAVLSAYAIVGLILVLSGRGGLSRTGPEER
ncbi:ABC transporter permease [Winogradskya humida]|uniref:Membrane protein n=1 Tax=Winogradskya humida TaxID=113566 RepID=A0ABQ3ZRD8_9ACTN|nr:ABC transporter permease [Actinoplanes humidus]GIE21150.1 membrane protein [Actinoplanes humidus]